jgi:hypothetical protein
LFAAGDHIHAVSLYRQIASGNDTLLASIARIHAGWAIADTASKKELETLLAPLTDSNNRWRGAALEILAYADVRSGNSARALKTYETLSADTSLPAPLRERAHIVADFLKAGGSKNYGTVPPPPSIAQRAGPIDIEPAAGGAPHK